MLNIVGFVHIARGDGTDLSNITVLSWGSEISILLPVLCKPIYAAGNLRKRFLANLKLRRKAKGYPQYRNEQIHATIYTQCSITMTINYTCMHVNSGC